MCHYPTLCQMNTTSCCIPCVTLPIPCPSGHLWSSRHTEMEGVCCGRRSSVRGNSHSPVILVCGTKAVNSEWWSINIISVSCRDYSSYVVRSNATSAATLKFGPKIRTASNLYRFPRDNERNKNFSECDTFIYISGGHRCLCPSTKFRTFRNTTYRTSLAQLVVTKGLN